MFTVIANFPVGTTGSVVFEQREMLFSQSEGIIPPKTTTATITSHAISQSLRPTTETGVVPQEWQYRVRILIDGLDELLGFMTLTEDSDLAEILQFSTPSTPEIFATRTDLANLESALGDPVSQEEVDISIADAVDAIQILLDAEETAREGADSALDGRLDTAEFNIGELDTDLATAEGTIAGHETRLDAIEAVPVAVVNTDDDPGVTIYIGTTDPADHAPPFTLATGDVWIDTTPAP